MWLSSKRDFVGFRCFRSAYRYKVIAILLFFISNCAGYADSSKWRMYSPNGGEFSVLMPNDVETRTIELDGLEVSVFHSQDGKHVYFVSGTRLGSNANAFEEFVEGVKRGASKKGAEVDSEEETKGDGWTGKLCRFSLDGNQNSTMVVARTVGADIGYVASVDAPFSDPDARMFLNSFTVVPVKAELAHKSETERRTLSESSSYKLGKLLGYCTIPGLLLIWLCRSLIKRSAKRKLKKDDQI